jgi:hypothetical protein
MNTKTLNYFRAEYKIPVIENDFIDRNDDLPGRDGFLWTNKI